MKRNIIKIFALMLIVAMMLCTFAGCSKKVTSGTYEAEISILGQSYKVSYTFKGNKVTAQSKLTVLGQVKEKSVSGTYEIVENSDGTMEITFSFGEETDILKNGTVTFEQGDDYIKLGGIKYTKAD